MVGANNCDFDWVFDIQSLGIICSRQRKGGDILQPHGYRNRYNYHDEIFLRHPLLLCQPLDR